MPDDDRDMDDTTETDGELAFRTDVELIAELARRHPALLIAVDDRPRTDLAAFKVWYNCTFAHAVGLCKYAEIQVLRDAADAERQAQLD